MVAPASRSPSRDRPRVKWVRFKVDDAVRDVNHPWRRSLGYWSNLTRRGQPRHKARSAPREVGIRKRNMMTKRQQSTFCSAAAGQQLHKSASSSLLLGSVGWQRSPPPSPLAAAATAESCSSPFINDIRSCFSSSVLSGALVFSARIVQKPLGPQAGAEVRILVLAATMSRG